MTITISRKDVRKKTKTLLESSKAWLCFDSISAKTAFNSSGGHRTYITRGEETLILLKATVGEWASSCQGIDLPNSEEFVNWYFDLFPKDKWSNTTEATVPPIQRSHLEAFLTKSPCDPKKVTKRDCQYIINNWLSKNPKEDGVHEIYLEVFAKQCIDPDYREQEQYGCSRQIKDLIEVKDNQISKYQCSYFWYSGNEDRCLNIKMNFKGEENRYA